MVRMKFQSWLLLAVLAVVVSFAAGIRQGISVEKQNGIQQRAQEAKVQPTPTPLPAAHFLEVVDTQCGVQYLLPDSVASGSGLVQINCKAQDSSIAAKLQKQGYQSVPIASDSATVDIWVKAPRELELLLQRTMRSMEAGAE